MLSNQKSLFFVGLAEESIFDVIQNRKEVIRKLSEQKSKFLRGIQTEKPFLVGFGFRLFMNTSFW
jgi:hypothetical protein